MFPTRHHTPQNVMSFFFIHEDSQKFAKCVTAESYKVNDQKNNQGCNKAEKQSQFQVILCQKECASLFQVAVLIYNELNQTAQEPHSRIYLQAPKRPCHCLHQN